jgi:hypothetical protein
MYLATVTGYRAHLQRSDALTSFEILAEPEAPTPVFGD